MDIQQQINAALGGRAAQRAFVDNLVGNWNDLTESFKALISSAAELAAAAAIAPSPDEAHKEVFSKLGSYLGAGGDWQKRALAVRGKLDERTDRVGVLQQRVRRETVNIGVIGVTGAGKSTLLRKLSGLDEDQIPSNRFTSSTATPSRIFHDSESAGGWAILNLHTWKSFREEVLGPLHSRAGLGVEPPASIDDFRQFRYRVDVPEGEAGPERFFRRLRIARDSLPSYQGLLRGGTQQITLDELRQYVAYPADESSLHRPYHAVRSVDIYCQFPELGAVSLGLVDLPGSGEAGLDVHKRFLADLQNSADLLFVVKRPSKSPATDPDWDLAQLADDAAAGVRRGDFAHQVVNRDADLAEEYFEQAMARAMADAAKLGIDVRVCDIQGSTSHEVTRAVLAPVLAHLAERLVYMDRDAVAFVLGGLASVTGEVRSASRELARQFEAWQASLPDEEKRRRDRVRRLKNQVAGELAKVAAEYDKMYEAETPISELDEQIRRAGREVREWLANGFGTGSRDKWLEEFQYSIFGRDMGDELDRQYNSAREKVVAVFGQIDASLEQAIERLYGEVAAALRHKLTGKVVPEGPANAAVLREFTAGARTAKAPTLAASTERLLALRADYGSIFLRVGRPLVRQIEWYYAGQQAKGGAGAAGVAGTAGGAAAGAVGAAAAGAVGAAALKAAAGVAGQAAGAALAPALAPAVGPVVGPVVGQAAAGAVGAIPEWMRDHFPGAQSQESPSSPSPAAGPSQSARGAGARPRDAAEWYDELTATVEDVTKQLEAAFHAEALQTLRVLAAAVDLFRDSTTTAPEIEVEFERVCSPAQREIWPAEFGEASSQVTADMTALRQQAVNAEATASQVASLVSQAPRL